jgi:hypothetical protein
LSSRAFFDEREDGCGNDVPVESKKRFPQGLGNLAQNARFPHFHSRFFSRDKEAREEQDTKNDGSDPSSDQPAAGSRILGQSGTGKNNCRQPAKVVDVDQSGGCV